MELVENDQNWIEYILQSSILKVVNLDPRSYGDSVVYSE